MRLLAVIETLNLTDTTGGLTTRRRMHLQQFLEVSPSILLTAGDIHNTGTDPLYMLNMHRQVHRASMRIKTKLERYHGMMMLRCRTPVCITSYLP